jgi:NADH dehydrogenase
MPASDPGTRQKVVIIGAGFGGLAAAKALAGTPVDVAIVDRRNYHLFQPLLYQVATADLSPADIAWPIRSIFSRAANVSVILGEVTEIDLDARRVHATTGDIPYDRLIVACGSGNTWFGHDAWAAHAPGLKTITDATTIRRRILLAFERAETATDAAERARQLTFVIIGGGPTGVEMAGAIAELARVALIRDFRHIDPRDARILLLEGGDRLLPALAPNLSAYARRALEGLSVEVRTGKMVEDIAAEGVRVGGDILPSATVIWAAGVAVGGPAKWLGVDPGPGGRIAVTEHLTVPGRPDIFVIGDAAEIPWPDGPGDNPTVPGIAPAAKQQGRYVAEVILASGPSAAKPFRYRHAGNLATIGRHRAVVDMGRLRLTGWPAWWFWGLAHIYFLIEVRSAALVLIEWFWTYLTRKKGARLITEAPPPAPDG